MSVSSVVMITALERYRTHTNYYTIHHPPVEWCWSKLRKPKSAIKLFHHMDHWKEVCSQTLQSDTELNSKQCHQNGYQLWEFGANSFTSTTNHHIIHNIFHACIRGNTTRNKQNPPVTQKKTHWKDSKLWAKFCSKIIRSNQNRRGLYTYFVLSELPVHINVMDA